MPQFRLRVPFRRTSLAAGGGGVCALAVLLGVLLAGCGNTETAPASPQEAARAAQVEQLKAAREDLVARQASFTPRTAEWTLGDTVSTLTGYYDGETLRSIDEQMSMGKYGNASARYFYTPAGKLFAYQETKQSRSGKAASTVTTELSELRLYIGESDTLLLAERLVDGKPTTLIGMEEQAVRMHAKELETALADSAAPKPNEK